MPTGFVKRTLTRWNCGYKKKPWEEEDKKVPVGHVPRTQLKPTAQHRDEEKTPESLGLEVAGRQPGSLQPGARLEEQDTGD